MKIKNRQQQPTINPNILQIRKDFPILKRMVNGRQLVYLDNAATSQKPSAVIQALQSYFTNTNANVHRALYSLANEATEAYENARIKIGQFIGANNADEIIFTNGTTSALNMLALSFSQQYLKKNDCILLTEMEHHSNLIPWQMAAKRCGAQVQFIPFDDNGTLDIQWLDDNWDSHTKIVSVTHMSNVFGTITDVKKIADIAHKHKALLIVDGAQSAPHLKINVQDIDCDFFVFSGHKMYGPMGIGVVYGKYGALQNMEPVFGGGEMIRSVWKDHATWNDIPYRFEAGTPNVAGAIALSTATDYIQSIGQDRIKDHEETLVDYALKKLQTLKFITLYGPHTSRNRGAVISCNVSSVHPHDVAQILDSKGIAVRAGHHCAQPLMRKLQVDATLRISFGLYTTTTEIDQCIDGLHLAWELLGNGI